MPMNDEVRKAVESRDRGYMNDAQWKTIRAELTRLAEIADSVDPLVVRLHDVTAENERLRDKADKFMWQVRDTCTRAEKAEAMLRDIAGCQWFAREAPATVELIATHLSENGHG